MVKQNKTETAEKNTTYTWIPQKITMRHWHWLFRLNKMTVPKKKNQLLFYWRLKKKTDEMELEFSWKALFFIISSPAFSSVDRRDVCTLSTCCSPMAAIRKRSAPGLRCLWQNSRTIYDQGSSWSQRWYQLDYSGLEKLPRNSTCWKVSVP